MLDFALRPESVFATGEAKRKLSEKRSEIHKAGIQEEDQIGLVNHDIPLEKYYLSQKLEKKSDSSSDKKAASSPASTLVDRAKLSLLEDILFKAIRELDADSFSSLFNSFKVLSVRSDLSDSFAVFTFQYQYTGRNVWDLDINSINVALIINTKNTLLSEAIERDDNAKVKFLLANGADPNFRLDRGMTPFLRAACKGKFNSIANSFRKWR